MSLTASFKPSKTYALVSKEQQTIKKLFMLLAGNIDANNGTFWLGNQILNRHALAKNVGLVANNQQIYNDTLLKNICQQETFVQTKRLQHILNCFAATHALIKEPNDLNLIIDVNSLSLYDRHIILLARILYKNFKILLLDDVDNTFTEKYWVNLILMLRKNFPNMTILLNTAQKGLIKQCNFVYAFDNGKLCFTGKSKKYLKN
ncbi:MAG: ABC transporter ATP-binding protein [Bacteroidales bacterium]|nr:ABC transporter ATP-binding protein [Bacteroidales bacterium]